jgi:tetratricopeptide (TPR) repeat protein
MAATPNHQEMPAVMSQRERVARDFLAQGRFRKARDEFKLLCKLDRPKFLPLLVEANIGLAREMAGKGMVDEAQQVLYYLKTIATPEQLLGLSLELQSRSAKPGQGPAVAEILWSLAKPSLAGAERQNLADWAVLAFEPVANPRPEVAALAQELAAIVSALQAISERHFDQALELIRPLGQASAFSHWKMFIKGLGAFYCGDWERATRFFGGLPAGSAPGKASQSYLLLLGSPPVSHDSPLPSGAVIEWACRMAGEPGLGAPLLRAEQAWRKGDPARMYQILRDSIPRFPEEGLNLMGVLSEFAVHCSFTLHFESKEDYLDLVDDVVEGQITPKNPVELQSFLRLTVLVLAWDMPEDVAIGHWEQFLRTREKLHGPNPALDSLAYGWLGDLFSQPPVPGASPFLGYNRSGARMRNATEAQRLLARAVNLDEENLAASLRLCEVYKERRLNADRNKLLDRMTARFPTEKQVLTLAGQACLQRKAYKRGLDYLDQALQLDRLDPAIPDTLVKAYLLQAREYFQKSRPDDARKAMGQTTPFEISTPGNLTRSPWCLKIQLGLIETNWGDPARGGKLLESARQESPSEAAFLYFAGFADLEIRPRTARGSSYFDKFARLEKSECCAAHATVLARVWLHGKEWLAERLDYEPKDVLENYLRAAARNPFSREDGCRLVEFCLAEDDFLDAALALVEKRLREDASDPLFRLYRMRFRTGTDEPAAPDKLRIKLESILAEATRRKEEQTVRQARRQLDALENLPPPPREPFGDLPPLEDEFDDGPVPDMGGGIPMLDEFFGNVPPGETQMMEEIMDMLRNASEKELKRLRKTRPPGMSEQAFEMLVELARAKRISSNAGFPPVHFPPPLPPRPKTMPPPDPTQQELF